MKKRPIKASDDVTDPKAIAQYAGRSILRNESAPCANPHCGRRVAYHGDFCRFCHDSQRRTARRFALRKR